MIRIVKGLIHRTGVLNKGVIDLLSTVNLRTTVREYTKLYPEDKLINSNFDLDRPIISYIPLFATYQYIHKHETEVAEEIQNIVYVFARDIQKQIDDYFDILLVRSSIPGRSQQLDRLFDEGANIDCLRLNHLETNRWWNEKIKEYRSIKLWVMFIFSKTYSIPDVIIQMVVDYLPWNKNVPFDDMFSFLLSYIKNMEMEIRNLRQLINK